MRRGWPNPPMVPGMGGIRGGLPTFYPPPPPLPMPPGLPMPFERGDSLIGPGGALGGGGRLRFPGGGFGGFGGGGSGGFI